MRTTTNTARGLPLAVLCLLLALLGATSWAVMAEESIGVHQRIDPVQIFVAGMGEEPTITSSTLVLQGLGPVGRYPVDVMFVLDASASADLTMSKQFAIDLVNAFGLNDRIGLISYATTARLHVPLTKGRAELKTAIADLTLGDKSALGAALQLARRELVENGRSDAVLAVILLSDGQNNVGMAPTVEGQVSEATGIRILSVGIGTLINRTLLEGFAVATEGLFFPRPSVDALATIVDHLRVDVAASEITVSKRIPDGLRLISSTPNATRVTRESDGSTVVTWQIAEILLGQTIALEVRVESEMKGAVATDAGSTLSYEDFRGVEQVQNVAPARLTVLMPNQPPVAAFEIEPSSPTTSDVVVFDDESTDVDEDGMITAWSWDFGDGTVSDAAHPEHRYAEQGRYTVTLTVMDDRGLESLPFEREIFVGNAAPVANFTVRDAESAAPVERPRVGVEISFDASASYDLDGKIAGYAWDFDGDGSIDEETALPEVLHSFESAGPFDVTLHVTDDERGTSTVTKKVTVLSSVTAIRTLETCLPDDRTIAGGLITVTVDLAANTTLNGLAVSETLPAGWTFAVVDNDGATMRQSGATVEWLFLERFTDASADAHRTIKYTLTAPSAELSQNVEQASIAGFIGSSSPRIRQTIGGEDKLTIVRYLSVPVAISRWDVDRQALDLCRGEQIGFDQIQYAVSLWLSGGTVPHTDNKSIDLLGMQDLIAYWLTASSVHDPLP